MDFYARGSISSYLCILALSIVMTNFLSKYRYFSLNSYIRSLIKSVTYIPILEWTTKDNPMTSSGDTASVKVILGVVALIFLQHFFPLSEYPLRSSLLTDQGYSSNATGMYPLRFNSASI